MPGTVFDLEPEAERRLAAALVNRVWDLLERNDRRAMDDDEMVGESLPA